MDGDGGLMFDVFKKADGNAEARMTNDEGMTKTGRSQMLDLCLLTSDL
jgi:hypothetical protein